jgi:hypothetical protein
MTAYVYAEAHVTGNRKCTRLINASILSPNFDISGEHIEAFDMSNYHVSLDAMPGHVQGVDISLLSNIHRISWNNRDTAVVTRGVRGRALLRNQLVISRFGL